MGAWASQTDALADLRRFVNDGPSDRPIKNKAVIGVVDGVNRTFVTYDDRLVPDSLAVTVNDVDAPVTLDDPILGEFTIASPPGTSTTIRARYFFQYFLDDDLVEALQLASGEIVEGDDITLVPPGLKGATLMYGKGFAFSKQAIRWASRMSERFLLQEAPIDSHPQTVSNLFQQISRDALKSAMDLRTSYYTAHGRRNTPAFAITKPRIPLIGPRR